MPGGYRVLGIDFGAKRIGLSISDPLGIIATPLDTFKNDEGFWDLLKALVVNQKIGSCVVGKPLTLRGESGPKAKEVEKFVERLKIELDLEVHLFDERFSTSMAEQTLKTMNTKKKARNPKSGTLDSMAAAIILQDYLDSRKNSLAC